MTEALNLLFNGEAIRSSFHSINTTIAANHPFLESIPKSRSFICGLIESIWFSKGSRRRSFEEIVSKKEKPLLKVLSTPTCPPHFFNVTDIFCSSQWTTLKTSFGWMTRFGRGTLLGKDHLHLRQGPICTYIIVNTCRIIKQMCLQKTLNVKFSKWRASTTSNLYIQTISLGNSLCSHGNPTQLTNMLMNKTKEMASQYEWHSYCSSIWKYDNTVPSMTSPPPSAWAEKIFVIYFLFFWEETHEKTSIDRISGFFPQCFTFYGLKKIKCTSFSRYWLKKCDFISELALYVWQVTVVS